jgi:hypothetical protein
MSNRDKYTTYNNIHRKKSEPWMRMANFEYEK